MREADCGLSTRGLCQADRLEEYFRNRIDRLVPNARVNTWKIISSPMYRCLLTSKSISSSFDNKEVSVLPFLFESHGCYRYENDVCIAERGYTKNEIETLFPHFKCSDDMSEGWFHLPTRETHTEYLHRAERVVDWMWNLLLNRKEDDDTEGIILVSHGNLMNAIITSLIVGQAPILCTKGLVTHYNTGISHLKLFVEKNHPQQRFTTVQYLNRVNHLLPDTALLTGNDPFKDHWVQEFLVPAAESLET